MSILITEEHLTCIHFDKTADPQIELVKIDKGEKQTIELNQNEILFFLEGRLQLGFKGFPEYEGLKGKILFLPAGQTYTCQALTKALVLVFRLTDAVRLCDSFHIEKLSTLKTTDKENEYTPHTTNFSTLDIVPRLWTFLDGLIGCLNDGVKCRVFFDMKIKEFFMMVRWYYPKEEIYDFLYSIISGDTVFSEYVRLNWMRYKNVKALAESMHMTPRRFSKVFVEVFGTTAYKWMKEGKTKRIYKELTTTDKTYKHIADENGFKSVQQFTKFVKEALGDTPGRIRAGSHREGNN